MSYSAEDDEALSFNWARATADMGALHCPKCTAQNRPGVVYVTREEDGTYVCIVCGHDWEVSHHD